jgi:hypothetical protein
MMEVYGAEITKKEAGEDRTIILYRPKWQSERCFRKEIERTIRVFDAQAIRKFGVKLISVRAARLKWLVC